MEDQIFIQHRFSIGDFNDAIVLPKDEYDLLKPEDIENIKKERLTNWKQLQDAQKSDELELQKEE